MESFEAVAARLGLEVASPAGQRLFGGHSLRVTGARWLAGLGLPLAVIQLNARWASDVIARYVGAAPLGTITAQYRCCVASRCLGQLLDTQHSALGDFGSELCRLKFSLAEALQGERELRALREACAPTGGLRTAPPFVISSRRTYHMVATRILDATPIFSWRAACGWQY